MAVCEMCGKKPQFGNRVSHSMRHTKRQFKPNIVQTTVFRGEKLVKVRVCAKCLKTLNKNLV